MSYERPAHNAAGASWVGSIAYVRPDYDAAGASFFPGFVPNGFSSTQFGTAFAVANAIVDATGFSPTQFGTAKLAHIAVGIAPGAFGTPIRMVRHPAGTLAPVAAFGTPTTPTDRVSAATGAVFTTFGGHPLASEPFTPAYRSIAAASSAYATRFGTPSTPVAADLPASGWLAARFGSTLSHHRYAFTRLGGPSARLTHGAAGSAFGIVPSPTLRVAGAAPSIDTGTFGTTSARMTLPVVAAAASRFGTPSSVLVGARQAYGFSRHGRFGQPRMSSGAHCSATGYQMPLFGAAAVLPRYRALHIPPEARFGTHLMRRYV